MTIQQAIISIEIEFDFKKITFLENKKKFFLYHYFVWYVCKKLLTAFVFAYMNWLFRIGCLIVFHANLQRAKKIVGTPIK